MMGKRTVRHYTDTERLGLMFMALRDGTKAVEEREHVPATTIRSWFEASGGGIIEVRRWLEEQTEGDYLRAERAIYDEVIRRTKGMDRKDLMVTFRKFIEARALPPPPLALAGAQAVAKTEVHVHLDDTGS